MSEPPVPIVSRPEPPVPRAPVCANCGADLVGEYCAACGQRHEPHIHSLAHFAGEAFESITHADSRLWRTLLYLLTRPGFLTREFFAGRRVSYLPAFRLYLVISVLFFVVARLPDQIFGAKAGVDIEIGASSAPAGQTGIGRLGKSAAAAPTASGAAPAERGLQDRNGMTDFCASFEKADPKAGPNYERLRQTCAKVREDHGAALFGAIAHNIPRAMFVFLPLIALWMKALYWRPARYYVEHLLLLVHNHAFVFLALAITGILERVPVLHEHFWPVELAVWGYILYYIFRSMRVFYEQSRGLTLVKFVAIAFAYLVTSFAVLLGTALFSAITLE